MKMIDTNYGTYSEVASGIEDFIETHCHLNDNYGMTCKYGVFIITTRSIEDYNKLIKEFSHIDTGGNLQIKLLD